MMSKQVQYIKCCDHVMTAGLKRCARYIYCSNATRLASLKMSDVDMGMGMID